MTCLHLKCFWTLGEMSPATPDEYTNLQIKCGTGGTVSMSQTVIIEGILQPETVCVPSNDPCTITPTRNGDGSVDNVMCFLIS